MAVDMHPKGYMLLEVHMLFSKSNFISPGENLRRRENSQISLQKWLFVLKQIFIRRDDEAERLTAFSPLERNGVRTDAAYTLRCFIIFKK